MKKSIYLLVVMLFATSCEKTRIQPAEAEICQIKSCYIDSRGRKVFGISDGNMAFLGDHDVEFCNSHYEFIGIGTDASYLRGWLSAEIGFPVKKLHYLSLGDTLWRYEVIMPCDTLIERKVVRVSKYDGTYNKVEGHVKLRSGFLQGTSGDGQLSQEEMASQNMFINIYFDDREPIAVTASDNQLFLDIEVGDTLIEKRINGKTTFSPKY